MTSLSNARTAGTPAADVVLGSGADSLVLDIAADVASADAQIVVSVDGTAIGGAVTAQALGASLTVLGNFGGGQHQVGLSLLDADAGDTLSLQAVSFDRVDANTTATLDADGTALFSVGTAFAVSTGRGVHTIDVLMGGVADQGLAQFTVSVDGAPVGGVMTVSAAEALNQVQDFTLRGDFASGTHRIAIDAVGGVAGRDLFVHGVALDGTTVLAGRESVAAGVQVVAAFSAPLASPVAAGAGAGAGAAVPGWAVPAVIGPVPPVGLVGAAIPIVAALVARPAVTFAPPATVAVEGAVAATPAIGADAAVGLVPVGRAVYPAGTTVLTVGVGRQFQTVAAAIGAAPDGSVILVDAGTYTNDFAVVNTKIALVAVGGRVIMDATVPPPNFKGILTVETGARIEGFTFTGAHIPDEEGHNGAGIRQEGGNLVLYNDEFENNQDGILTGATDGAPQTTITIDHSLFDDNGGDDGNGAGNIHNVYIGGEQSATVTNSIFENAQVGHEFKSRAAVNTLTDNEFVSGVGIGTGSYDIDLPNGGVDTVSGNTIVKGPNAENDAMVHFGGEGVPYAGSSLTVTDNDFVSTNAAAVGVLNQTAVTVSLAGNRLDGLAAAALAAGPSNASGDVDAAGMALPNATLVGVVPGSTLFETDALDHTIVMSAPYQGLEGGAGHLSIDLVTAHVVMLGGSGGMDVLESGTTGGNGYTTAAGSTNSLLLLGVGEDTIDSEGDDTIVAGGGNQTGVVNGTATIVGGIGTDSWSVSGTADIDAEGASTFISLGATAALTLTGTNTFYTLNGNGGGVRFDTVNSGVAVAGSITGAAFTMQVYGGLVQISTAVGGTGGVLRFDQGDAVVKSFGQDSIFAGAGNDTVIVDAAATIHAGSGVLSVFNHGDSGAVLFGAGGDYTLGGDGGDVTFEGGALGGTVEAQLSSLDLLGGAGAITVNGGSRETVVGGSGGVVFHDFGAGANTVTTVTGARDTLELSGGNQVVSRGDDSIVTDGGNDTMSLYGTSMLSLGGGNSTIDLFGTDDVTAPLGTQSFVVGAGAVATLALGGVDWVVDQGGSLALSYDDGSGSGPVAMTVAGGGASLVAAPGQGVTVTTNGTPTTVAVSTGAATVQSFGADDISLVSGTVAVDGTGATIWAGSGATAVFDQDWAGGGQFVLHGGSGAVTAALQPSEMTFIGGSGTAVLSGGAMAITGGDGAITATNTQMLLFQGGAGSADLSVNGAGSTFVFGAGPTHVSETPWGVADVYRILAGASGADVIDNFRVGVDQVQLGAGVSVVSTAVVGGAAEMLFSTNALVRFTGVSTGISVKEGVLF